MRIENFVSTQEQGRARVAATVTYEDCERPAQELFFETDEAFASDLTCNPHAFLVASIMSALRHGEQRVFVDGEVCPELREGLMAAMAWMRHWYYKPERKIVQIEAKTRSQVLTSHTPGRAASFFSGGIDSLAAVRANRLNYPLEHPGSIKDSLIIYGQNPESDPRPETFEQAVRVLSEVTRAAGVTLIPVYTNLRSLDGGTKFFLKQLQAAILTAVAHAFTRRLARVTIASGHDIPNQHPSGTSAILDPNYSSSDLRVLYGEITLSRLEKTRLIADWDAGLHGIKVCPKNWPGDNCGRCEKCLRTMLTLLVIEALERCRAFPRVELTEELIDLKVRMNTSNYTFYEELALPLADAGRQDLVQILEKKLASFYGRTRKRRVKQMGRKYLRSNLGRLKSLNLFNYT